jgi:hypothetical protein
MMDDNGLADALARDAARTAKLEEYRQAIRSQLDATMEGIKPVLADLTDDIHDSTLREAVKGLAVMNAVTAFSLSLSIQGLSGVVFNLVPEEERDRAMKGYEQMSTVISEETARFMDGFDG